MLRIEAGCRGKFAHGEVPARRRVVDDTVARGVFLEVFDPPRAPLSLDS